MANQFATAKAFADFICKSRYGRGYVAQMNKKSGNDRIVRLCTDIQRYASTRLGWGVENDGVEFKYSQAAYGLNWAIETGRCNAQTVLAVRELNTRQLCELVHDLMVFGYDISTYPAFLMRKFTPQYFAA